MTPVCPIFTRCGKRGRADVSEHRVRFGRDPRSWSQAQGHEYAWIAESIAAGAGFSYPGERRWMFQTQPHDRQIPEHGPTVWKEPVYPYMLGGAMRLFGPEGGRVLVVVLQTAALALTLRRRSVYLLPLTIALMSVPLLITAPLYYRYQLPFEPLLAILAAGAATACMQFCAGRMHTEHARTAQQHGNAS